MKNIILLLTFICIGAFKSQAQTPFVPDEIEVHTSAPTLWNKEFKTTSFLSLFPAGSTVIGCADAPLYASRNNPQTQEYWGTVFLVKLPGNIALAVVADSSHYVDHSNGAIQNLWLNVMGHTESSIPLSYSDPDFTTGQYHMKYDLAAISSGVIYTGWQHSTGYVFKNTNRILVAVLDGGLNFSHQDVINASWVNTSEIPANGIDDDANGYIDDVIGQDIVNNDNNPADDDPSGHGSHVFGIIAARNNNAKNICGVITDTLSTMVVKVANASGVVTDFNTAAGYYYALGKHVRVVNMSFGFSFVPSALMAAIATGVTSSYKCVPVAGVGNGGIYEFKYPGAGAHVLCIGNSNSAGVRDVTSSYNDSLDLLARGVNVKSISATSSTATVVMSGSSMSSPFGSGCVHDLLKIDSNLSVDQTIAIMRSLGDNHGVFVMTEGYGYIKGLDTLRYNYMKPDSLVSFPACTGKYALPYTHDFAIVDSLRYGLTSIVGDSINTNGMAPGTYIYYMAWKSERNPGEIYRDTFTLKVIITGTVLTPSVSMSATPSGAICAGTTASFTAMPTHGGTSPTYEWKVNGIVVSTAGPTYGYTPLSGDVVSVKLNSSIMCVTTPTATATMTMTVNPTVTPSVTIAPAGTVCAGTATTFTPSPVGGGSPTYQWYKNGTLVSTSGTYFTSGLVAGDNVWCSMTSTALCATPTVVNSNTVTATAAITSTASISASPGSVVCAGTLVTFTCTTSIVGGNYQWNVNGTNVGPSSPTYGYTPLSGDVVKCTVTPVGGCYTGAVTSTTITMTVNPNITSTATIAVSPGSTVCAGTTVTFTCTTSIVGGAYQWHKGGTPITGATLSTYSYIPSMGDVITCKVTPLTGCYTGAITSAGITMTVNPVITSTATISASPGSTVCSGTTVTFTVTTSITGGTYQWYKGGTPIGGATFSTYAYIPLTGDVITCMVTPVTGCYTGAVTSAGITMTVTAPITPSSTATATSTSICSLNGDTINASCSVVGATAQWQSFSGSWTNITGATAPTYYTGLLPVGVSQFRCIFTMPVGCYTRAFDTTLPVSITVVGAVPAPACSITPGIPFWTAGHVDIIYTAFPAGGPYDWYHNGSLASTTPGNTWLHTMSVPADTVFAVYKPVGCYVPDTSISNILRVPNPLDVAATNGLLAHEYKIFPNPVKDILHIKGANVYDHVIVENMLGQKVIDYKLDVLQQINVTTLIPGVYIFKLYDSKDALLEVEQFIKQE